MIGPDRLRRLSPQFFTLHLTPEEDLPPGFVYLNPTQPETALIKPA
jgi:hypothetical protein